MDAAGCSHTGDTDEIRLNSGEDGQKGGNEEQDPLVERHADDEVVFTGGCQQKHADKCGQDGYEDGRELNVLEKQLR